MKQKLLTLFTLLLTVCSGAWAQTTFDFSEGSTTGLTIEKSGTVANVEYAVTNEKYASKISPLATGSYFLGMNFINGGGGILDVTTTESFSNIKSISFDTAASDNSKPTMEVFIVDANDNETKVLASMAVSSGSTNTWRSEKSGSTVYTIDLSSSPKTGKVHFKFTSSNSGKVGAIDNIVITEAAPAGVTKPSFDLAAGSSIVKNTESAVTLTSAGNTIYYKWNALDNAYAAGAALEGAAEGNGSSPVDVTAPNATGDTYLYAVAKDGEGKYSDVVKRLYTIINPSYTVTLNTNGGTINEGNVTVYVEGTGATLPANVTKDCYTFAGWYDNSGLTGVAVTTISTEATGNKEYWAKWTPLYTTGTYTFENNKTVGTEPSKTVTTEVKAYDAFRVDNMFFSNMSIQYEEGTYSGEGDDFKGWKIKTSGASIKLLVENDADVTFGVGNLSSGAKVSYTKQDGTPSNNNALVAKTDNVYSVKGGTIVTFVTDGASTVTLKKIEVVAPAAKFDVTYNANGSGEEDVVRNVSKVDENMFTYAGHSFTGWNTQADGKGTAYAVGAAVTSTLTLFAQWAENVAPTAGVIFSANATSEKSFDKESTTEITSTNADISGGKMYAINGQDSSKKLISNDNSGSFVLTNNNTIFKIVLDNPLKAGDVITCNAKGGSKNGSYDALGLWISTSESRPGSAPACAGADADATTMHQMIDYTVQAGDDYDNATTLYIHRAYGGTTYFDEFTITRNNSITLNNVDGAANGFSTFCSPNNFTVTGATAYKASIADNKLTLKEVTGIIPANAGVILAGTKGATATIAYTNSTATADMKDNDLKGTTARVLTSTLKGEYDHFLAFQKTTNTFKEYNGTNFPANKAYVVTDDAPSREFEMIFSDQDNNEQGTETDGIAGVEAEKNANVAYNLAGQKVGKDYKGIVIVNGKKLIRK